MSCTNCPQCLPVLNCVTGLSGFRTKDASLADSEIYAKFTDTHNGQQFACHGHVNPDPDVDTYYSASIDVAKANLAPDRTYVVTLHKDPATNGVPLPFELFHQDNTTTGCDGLTCIEMTFEKVKYVDKDALLPQTPFPMTTVFPVYLVNPAVCP